MVELRRPVQPASLEQVKPVLEKEKKPLISPRHKPKPEVKPPVSTEEWINRANADGPATSTLLKPIAVSLDAGSVQLLEDLAIHLSMNKLAVISRMIQEAPDQLESIRAFRQTFSDPLGPYLNRSFRIPEAVIASSNQLPKQLRIYGRSKIIRLLIAYFASRYEIE